MGAVVGALAGWLWDREPDRDAVPAAAEDCPACPAFDTEACAEPVREAVDAVAAEHARLFGTPVPFPDDLPPEHLPDAFRANLARALAECDTGLALIDVDCREYPCLALFEGSGTLPNCPAWTDIYGNSSDFSAHSIATADGERSWVLFAVRPPGIVLDRNHRLRIELRRDDARDRLFGLWGGSSTASDHRAAQIAALELELEGQLSLLEEQSFPPELVEPQIEEIERQIEEIERIDELEAERGAQ
jgi:hypothetical protein